MKRTKQIGELYKGMQIYFFTGYPGFLASSLIKQLITDHQKEIKHVYLLVLPHLIDQAEEKITHFAKANNVSADLFTIVPGDITKPGLAIQEGMDLQLEKTVTHVFHLAAIYDLAVEKEAAYHVNVNGTKQVNDWVETLDQLDRYIYFSTAYVAGTREGRIYEDELIKGQSFKNHYEETKYHAEVLVDNLKEKIPITIIRPGVVKGDSKTGETIKFDGLYFMLNFFDRVGALPIIPYFGAGDMDGNFVPADYVLEATSYLAIAAVGNGKTYHLADPNPYTMKELSTMLSETYLNRKPNITLPVSLAKLSLSSSFARKWLQIEKEVLDYYIIDNSYDCSVTVADLDGSGIVCPDLKDTLEPMIAFYRKYKDDKTKHIHIV